MPKDLRILLLATCFPKPSKPWAYYWAIEQAWALQRVAEVRVVSPTSWVPAVAARFGKARDWALCPSQHQWQTFEAQYPRWLAYQAGRLAAAAYVNPEPQMRIGWYSIAPALRRAARRFRPDVILSHHTATSGYLAMRLGRELGLPFVTVDWDFDELESAERLPLRRAFLRRVFTAAAASVAVARRMERAVRALHPAATTRTIYSGVAPIEPDYWKTPRPADVSNRTVIYSAANFYERKGGLLLVSAFAKIAARYPGAVLRVAGYGQQVGQMAELAGRLGIAGQFQFLGTQTHERVLQEIVWCDLFALFGWNEPFATVYMEAMAAGKPIACASDGGVNDLLTDGQEGIAVAPRNVDAAAAALDRLLSEPSARLQMGAAGRQLFDRHLDSRHTADQLLQTLHAAVNR
ncbi:MAG TPA: glycosyltransferase [Tepidisphaeraceae bacterium]|jgi:glycosyltransferase involved in cell wall biosynthesis